MTSPDFLSVCPSLLDTLCLVNYSDIPNCKLVSRRFWVVIKNSRNLLGREEMDCTFQLEENDPQRYGPPYNIWLRIKGWRSFEYEVYDDRVRVLRGNEGLKENFDRRGIRSTFHPAPTAQSTLLIRSLGKSSIDYWFPSLLDGLRAVLSVLFRRYHFSLISLGDADHFPFPSDLYDEIGGLYRQAGCRFFFGGYVFAEGLNGKFMSTIDSTRASMYCGDVLSPINLSSLEIWKQSNLDLTVSPDSITSLSQITDVLKIWEQLACQDSFTFELTSRHGLPSCWTWSRRELAATLINDLQYSLVEFNRRHLDDDTIKDFCLRIIRKSDGLVMNIHYEKEERQMTLIVG